MNSGWRWLAAVCILLSCCIWALPARAADREEQISAIKTAAAVNGDGRSFRLDYKVWSEDAGESQPVNVILLLDISPYMEKRGLLDAARREGTAFLARLEEAAPSSRMELLCFGAGEDTPDYASALEESGKLAKEWKPRPLYLVTLTSGTWAGGENCLVPLQALRSLGAKTYTVLLCGSPSEEAEIFWQSMSSAPLGSCHYLCRGEASGCLTAIGEEMGLIWSVEVRQRLDPRFTVDGEERNRLLQEGVHLTEETDGSLTLSWQADLPRKKASPWTAFLFVRARDGFPGGNDIPTDGEGTGLYRAGKRVSLLPLTSVNAALQMNLSNFQTELFLGQKVRTAVGKGKVEDAMRPLPNWFGMGQTGAFSFLWETESGDPIGSVEQLETLQPKENVSYRLRVTYRPGSLGLLSAGKPVGKRTGTALYKIKVVSGTLRIKASAGEGVELCDDSFLTFRLERREGGVYYRSAKLERDPEGGGLFLEAEAAGLPYGFYTVTPVTKGGLACCEESVLCELGVWSRDDTVSTERKSDWAKFTLREG